MQTTKLGDIHIFASEEQYNANISSIDANDLSLVPATGEVSIDTNIDVSASTQTAISPTTSKNGNTVTINVSKVTPMFTTSGTYELQELVQMLAAKAHTHSKQAVTFTDSIAETDSCSGNSCTSNNDCH